MRALVLVVTALALAGCAARIVSSSPRSVVVDAGIPPAGKSAQAMQLAEAACAKHQRHARMVARPIYDESREYVFDCVE